MPRWSDTRTALSNIHPGKLNSCTFDYRNDSIYFWKPKVYMALIGDKGAYQGKTHINLNRVQKFTTRTVAIRALLVIKLLAIGDAY